MRKPMIIIAGPTAAGKTSISLSLSEALNGSVVSADSMQVYRGMDIGSAKIAPADRRDIDHYMIDVADPKEPFDVEQYKAMAEAAVNSIYSKNRIPIITGGTGFYIQALLYDIDFSESTPDAEYRRHLKEKSEAFGNDVLHQLLAEIDPESACTIHPNNIRKVIRALEFYHQTGIKISEHNKKEYEKKSPYDYRFFVISSDRDVLYKRIDDRVDSMMQSGLLEEVIQLKENGCTKDMTSMQGLGYRELMEYLDGKYSLDEAVRQIKQDTRHYAKRQLTWFRREKNARWFFPDEAALDQEELLACLIQESKEILE